MKRACLSALVLTTALSSAFNAHALQTLEGAEGRKHVVRVPSRELTRIGIADGRIQSMRYLAAELEVEKDEAAGAVYVRPRATEKQISLFVISASGATHELVLQPVETMPLESVQIKDPAGKRAPAANDKSAVARATSFDQAVARLVLQMARGPAEAVDVAYEKLEIPVALWVDSRFVLSGRYRSRNLTGEAYRLTNAGNNVMRVAEQELFKPGVASVVVENQVLRPGESTDVYVIRMNRDE